MTKQEKIDMYVKLVERHGARRLAEYIVDLLDDQSGNNPIVRNEVDASSMNVRMSGNKGRMRQAGRLNERRVSYGLRRDDGVHGEWPPSKVLPDGLDAIPLRATLSKYTDSQK